MITEEEKKVESNDQEQKNTQDYLEKLKNRGSVKCLIEISTFGI